MSSIWPASFEQFRSAAAGGNCVPVVRTVPAETHHSVGRLSASGARDGVPGLVPHLHLPG